MKRLILFSIIAIVCVAGLAAGLTWRALHSAQSHHSADEFIIVSRGMTPSQIVHLLAAKNIVADELPLLAYMKITGEEEQLKAGEYKFPSPITPLDVLRRLQIGQQRSIRFTVIEGWTRWDIAAAMTRVPELKLTDRDTALALMNDVSLIADIDPAAQNLEGYLYPDTYTFPVDVTPQRIVAAMVKRFRDVWVRETAMRPAGLSPRETMTIAALIETEAKLAQERPLVASVIYNRLRGGMALGIDSSVIYASKLAGKWRNDGKVYQSDLDRDSPYNTRKTSGLPPGPIASASESSIRAALAPASTNYLYYVRDPQRDDGAHNFYADEAGFYRGVQALREWERKRDARG